MSSPAEGERPMLMIDPARQFGSVCVAGTRTPAESLSSCVIAGDSVSHTAKAFDVSEDDVRLACWWEVESARTAERKSARQSRLLESNWVNWADRVFGSLARHSEAGPAFDPPSIDAAL